MPALASPAVQLLGLTKFYGRDRGIEELSLRVETGEVFGLPGPNGAGKTTAIRLLLDLIRPTSGRALVLGFDANRDILQVRRRVGYLPGELKLPERSTARHFLGFLDRLRGHHGADGSKPWPGASGSPSIGGSETSPRETSRRSAWCGG